MPFACPWLADVARQIKVCSMRAEKENDLSNTSPTGFSCMSRMDHVVGAESYKKGSI